MSECMYAMEHMCMNVYAFLKGWFFSYLCEGTLFLLYFSKKWLEKFYRKWDKSVSDLFTFIFKCHDTEQLASEFLFSKQKISLNKRILRKAYTRWYTKSPTKAYLLLCFEIVLFKKKCLP